MKQTDTAAVIVWDLPTRLFHWLLAVLIIGSFVTINLGGNWVDWHMRIGYLILGLIGFRLIWGFVGGRYARFSSFLFSPRQIVAYLKGAPDAPQTAGHNPLGSLSVFALLFFIGAQAVLGLFANDDIASEGPLAVTVSKATSDFLTGLHHRNEPVLFALIGLHIAAIVFYRVVRGKNLATAMLFGRTTDAPPDSPSSRDDAALRLRALAVAAAVAILVWWLVR